MLKEPEFFDAAGTLPDVSKVVPPHASGAASALAGITSGQDYAKAIYAAAYRPLDAGISKPANVDFDQVPRPEINKAAIERREMARDLRRSLGGSGRPDYVAPEYPQPPPPGTDGPPVANSEPSGNLLAAPPDNNELFPTVPPPILPPPVATKKDDFNPADIFNFAY